MESKEGLKTRENESTFQSRGYDGIYMNRPWEAQVLSWVLF